MMTDGTAGRSGGKAASQSCTELRLQCAAYSLESVGLRTLSAQLRAESQALRRAMRRPGINQVGLPEVLV